MANQNIEGQFVNRIIIKGHKLCILSLGDANISLDSNVVMNSSFVNDGLPAVQD